MSFRVIVDAREWRTGPPTGIGRVLQGVAGALAESELATEIMLAVRDPSAVPLALGTKPNISLVRVSALTPVAETQLAQLAQSRLDLFLTPYPNLPMWPLRVRTVHIVHDVLYLTDCGGQGKGRWALDQLRLRWSLMRSDLTWYDSRASMADTRRLAGRCGRQSIVRYPGIDEVFSPEPCGADEAVVRRYGLFPGYILVAGNGRPHKNLGVLLKIAGSLRRPLALVGVTDERRRAWENRFPNSPAAWVGPVAEADLPAVMRQAFCLAQPSLAEGYGYPPLEAMACGTPAVVSDIPVLCETTGGRAVLADPNDPQTWLEAFAALEEPETRQRLTIEGRKWARPLQGKQAWHAYVQDLAPFRI